MSVLICAIGRIRPDDDDERILAAWASQAGVYTRSVV